MSDTVLVALISLGGTISAALITALVALANRPKPTPPAPSTPVVPVRTATQGSTAPPLRKSFKEPEPMDDLDDLLGTGPEPDDECVPGVKGSYVLWVGPPIAATPRFVHFSWGGRAGPESFKVRDFIGGRLLQHGGATRQTEEGFQVSECSLSRDEVWAAAQVHIPARGELFRNVKDFAWWRARLTQLAQERAPV